MTHNFTDEEIKILVKAEQGMDAGLIPFVIDTNGNRMIVEPFILEKFGIKSGQNVSSAIVEVIIQTHLAQC